MASSQFSVSKSDGEFVIPCEPTPTHTLPLSWLDQIPVMPIMVEMFIVFKEGQQPAEVIKEALAKALVPYYPVAGRLVRSDQGVITEVACTSDGVWFIDASADCSLEDMMGCWLKEHPSSGFPSDQILPSHPNPVGMSLMLQVTQFTCGGFVIGLKFDHIMADGIGIAQIMKGVADIARGLEQPMVKPIWLREHAPKPPAPKMFLPPPPTMPLEHLTVDVPQDHINRVKNQFIEQTGDRCSTFDVVIAQLWQCRIRAIDLDPSIIVSIEFAVSTRHLLNNFLPEGTEGGYYGNCIYPLSASATSGKIVGASIVEMVALIRDAKKRLPDEFAKWAKGEHEPHSTMGGYDSLGLTDWSGIGFSEVDYGWGGPAYYAPVPPPPFLNLPPVCLMLKSPAPKEGRRLITKCVRKEHFEAFYDQMTNFPTNNEEYK